MAEIIQIKVEAQGAAAVVSELTQIKNLGNDIKKNNPIKIKIETEGDVKALQAAARLEAAKAKRISTENRLKIAQEQTKQAEQAANREKEKTVQIEKQATLEIRRRETAEQKRKTAIKQGETAEKQAALATERATEAEKKRALAIEQGKTAQKQKQLQEEKTKTATENHAAAEAKAAAAADRRATAEAKVTGATKALGDASEVAAKQTESLWENFTKFARWYIIGNAFSGIVRSMREAMEVMKQVDDELVTIRKVTGFSNTQIDAIRSQAYHTGSEYGVGAADYLSSVAEFSRAGYKEQAAALAELSVKTQIVGDTTAETANQFLISADAAYKYNGNIEKLTAVLDGSNEIDNKYATSIAKIAEAIGIVAPVAAQAHVGIEELAAAIGTITAVTQRSGSEAARALRALFLNIVGDTKTEIDEGVTWTTGEIAGLRDVIRQYAPEAYKAAEATGAVIDPMEAIGGLAKSMQEGLLTEQQLMTMVSDIGGKLRTSQLLAIVQNWDMYQSMLQDYAGAIGSADKEVENALDSWTRKTNQLSNAWAKFVSHLIETKEIKNGIGLLTKAIQLLDSEVGKGVTKAALFTAAFAALNKITKGGLVGNIRLLTQYFMGLQTQELLAAQAAGTLQAALLGLKIAAVAGLIYVGLKALDALTISYKEAAEQANKLNTEFERQFGAGSEYENLKSKVDDLNVSEAERLALLEGQKAVMEAQVKLANQEAAKKWLEENSRNNQSSGYIVNGASPVYKPTWDSTGHFSGFDFDTTPDGTIKTYEKNLTALKNAIDEAARSMKAGLVVDTEAFHKKLTEGLAPLKDYYDGLVSSKNAGAELNAEETEFIRLYEIYATQIGKATEATEDNTGAINANAAANKTLAKAFEEVEKKSSLTYGTLAELEALYPGLSKRILDANGNLTAEGQAAMSTKSALYQLISEMIAANTTGMNFDSQIAALQELASAAGVASSMISAIFSGADLSVAGTGDWDEVSNMTPDQLAQYRARSAAAQTAALLKKQAKDDDYIVPGGGGGGSSKTPEELATEAQKEELNRRKQAVADEKAKYNLMEAQGASAEELAKQAGIIQGKLHDQAEYMREIKANYSDTASVSKEWWDWESKKTKIAEDEAAARLQEKKDAVSILKQELAFLKASGAPLDDQIAKQKKIQRALHDQAEYMRSIKADEKDITALSTEWWDIQKDILESTEKLAQVLKDQIADVLGGISDALSGAAEAATQPLQEELDALIAAHDAAQDRREEEEKILAVEKARIALVNAERDRSVRQYNAAAGQWEWVANPKNLESARKSLADAEANLAKYREEQIYKARKESLETEIDGINGAFDTLKSAIEEAAQAIRDGKMSYEEAYAYIKGEMHRIQDDYGIDMTELLGEAENNLISGFAMVSDFIRTALQTADPGKAIQELTDAIRGGIVTDLSDIAQIMAALNGEYAGLSEQTARIWALTRMQANSVAWHLTDDQATRNALHEENMQLGGMLGLNYEHGKWYDQSGSQVYTLSNVGGEWTSTLNAALQNVVDAINSAASGASASSGSGAGASSGSGNSGSSAPTSNGTTTMTGGSNGATGTAGGVTGAGRTILLRSGKWSNIPKGTWPVGTYVVTPDGTYVISAVDSDGSYRYQFVSKSTGYSGSPAAIYDQGGILHGRGGIKATARDEMVLPPDATSAMLRAENNGAFAALLNHLGIVTAAANSIAGFGGGVPGTNIGEQHNGDIYKFGSISISEREARSMTVYDLAQMARNLQLVRN